MTSASTFPRRLTKIDDLTRADHSYLTTADACYFLGEYTARKGYAFSPTNRLIFNLKKGMERRDRPEWRYKAVAIQTVADALRAALNDKARQTLVSSRSLHQKPMPIPPITTEFRGILRRTPASPKLSPLNLADEGERKRSPSRLRVPHTAASDFARMPLIAARRGPDRKSPVARRRADFLAGFPAGSPARRHIRAVLPRGR